MDAEAAEARLNRHALVLAVWLAAGVPALVMGRLGLGGAGIGWLAGAFAALLAGFAGHLIVNAVLGTRFTPREVALALVVTLTGLLALVLAALTAEGFAATYFLPLTGGLALLVAAVVGAMVIRHGPRGAFAIFDVARANNPRTANRLSHRGGRR